MLSNDVLIFQILHFIIKRLNLWPNMKMKNLQYNISVCMKNEPQNDS